MKKILDWVKGLFVSLGGNAIGQLAQSLGESKLEAVLDDLHDSDEADHLATIAAAHTLAKHLAPGVAKTASKVDDLFVEILNDIANQQAAKYNITLP